MSEISQHVVQHRPDAHAVEPQRLGPWRRDEPPHRPEALRRDP
jgi:hypothetical protein